MLIWRGIGNGATVADWVEGIDEADGWGGFARFTTNTIFDFEGTFEGVWAVETIEDWADLTAWDVDGETIKYVWSIVGFWGCVCRRTAFWTDVTLEVESKFFCTVVDIWFGILATLTAC